MIIEVERNDDEEGTLENILRVELQKDIFDEEKP